MIKIQFKNGKHEWIRCVDLERWLQKEDVVAVYLPKSKGGEICIYGSKESSMISCDNIVAKYPNYAKSKDPISF